MTDTQHHAAVLAVLTENGVTAPETDLDTLATRIVAAFDVTNPEGTQGDDTPAETPAPTPKPAP